ncbi:MAG: RecX family transcriptional regulator [Clostridia bacterium]|nr:RecX family transcriptional regulator [Clostridia bacterium]
MIKLTIRPGVKNKNRFLVFSGEEYLFSISRYTYRRLGTPEEIAVDSVEEFQRECIFPEQYGYCLDLLSRRGYSSRELQNKLADRGVPDAVIEEIINRLTEEKLICDEEFTKDFVRSRQLYHKQGYYKIRQDLLKKGISLSRDEYNEEAEREVLKELVKKLSDTQTEPKKIISRLMRKGFRYGEIAACLRELEFSGEEEVYEEFNYDES